MKKVVLIIGSILTSVIVIAGLLWLYFNSRTFYLENKYYGSAKNENATTSSNELELKDIEKLINEKESFAVFVYQPLCTTSADFSDILNEFSKEKGVHYLTIAYSEIKDSKTFDYIKYYPSFIIFKEGKMVDFLDAESSDDTKKFKEAKEFEKWFTSYVKLRDKDYTYEPENKVDENTNTPITDVKLEDVKRDDNKVNIYFFWGDGCSHCKAEKAYFEDLKKKHGNKYNLYLFEVWYNKDNQNIMKSFASAMGDEAKGVPYTVIGNQSFEGFSADIGKQMTEAITSQYQNSYDVYFDKILTEQEK